MNDTVKYSAFEQCMQNGMKRFLVGHDGSVAMLHPPSVPPRAPQVIDADSQPWLDETLKMQIGEQKMANHLVPDEYKSDYSLAVQNQTTNAVFIIANRRLSV